MKIIISDEADNDLLLIFSYLHQQSSQAAETVAGELDRCIEDLPSFPFSGAARPDLGPDVRSIVVSLHFGGLYAVTQATNCGFANASCLVAKSTASLLL
jgi:plasmid stabilization system protein ParE